MDLGLSLRDIGGRELAELARFAEDTGYTDIYVPDGSSGGLTDADGRLTGHDAFSTLAAMFSATDRVVGAVGVAAVIGRYPGPLALAASTLHEQSGGRFALGIGVSHPELAAGLGVPFPTTPLAYMRDWLTRLRVASAGGVGGVAFGAGWPVLLGALGPKMTQLGATAADGVVLNWMTPTHTGESVRAIQAAAPATATHPAKTVLYVRLMPAEAARREAAFYDGLGNYHRHFVAQGLTDVDAIVAGATLPADDLGAARAQLERYRESGLDLLCIRPDALTSAQRTRALTELVR